MIPPCCICGIELFECMGSPLTRDICDALDGKIEWADLRQVCSKCAWIHRDTLQFDTLPRK